MNKRRDTLLQKRAETNHSLGQPPITLYNSHITSLHLLLHTSHESILMNSTAILLHLQDCLPQLLAVYAFGSRIQGTARADSDLDLALLVPQYVDSLALWELASELAGIAGCEVDLVDLRAASTVMQYQIITTGQRWWAKDAQAALYEAAILSEKTALDSARAGLLEDIQQKGTVYGR